MLSGRGACRALARRAEGEGDLYRILGEALAELDPESGRRRQDLVPLHGCGRAGLRQLLPPVRHSARSAVSDWREYGEGALWATDLVSECCDQLDQQRRMAPGRSVLPVGNLA